MADGSKSSGPLTGGHTSTKQHVDIGKGLHGADMLKPQAKPSPQSDQPGSATTKHDDYQH